MARILPELYNLGYTSVKQPRKGSVGKPMQNVASVYVKTP